MIKLLEINFGTYRHMANKLNTDSSLCFCKHLKAPEKTLDNSNILAFHYSDRHLR
jgi:hypothetical protein